MSTTLPQLPWLGVMLILAGIAMSLGARADGPDLPTAGRSLFDHLTFDGQGRRHVPFPFTALLARIEREVGRDALGHPGVRSVLIPLGRSLQRNASVEQAYRFPRAVAAVVGEPRPGAPLLRDRLYLGYHEQSAVLEVISYNEAAGRFEFQVVKDYRAGGTPRVFQARRVVCLACHHGAAPIFSRPGWDETNANPRVAARLAQTAAGMHGLPARRSLDEPEAIDDAVLRAARFSTTQRIWREGCPDEAAVACRAQALQAALRLRLGGGGADSGPADAAMSVLASSAAKRWPDGLPVPEAEIPNRDPLAVFASGSEAPADAASLLRMADIRPAFDPLQARPPRTVWRADRQADRSAYLRDVAQFFSDADLVTLASALRAARPQAPRQSVHAECVARPGSVLWQCRSARGSRPELQVLISTRDGETVVDRIAVDAASGPSGPIVLDRKGKLAMREIRLSDGSAIDRLRFDRTSAGPAVEIDRIDDGAVLAQAIARLAAATRAGETDALSDAPLRRAAVLRALHAQLGRGSAPACCDGALHGDPPALDLPPSQSAEELPQTLAPFRVHCSACHATRESTPPGFMLGDADAVARKIARCAPRIAYRLAMWQQPAAARPRTPMPPPTANGIVVAAPPAADLDLMRSHAERIAGPPAVDVPYESLPACRSEEEAKP